MSMQIDYFAIFGEPRRCSLDPEQIKDAFHELSRKSHPDQAVAGDECIDFSVLNAAQLTLREPKARLRHLLELEFPEIASQLSRPATIAGDLADVVFTWQDLLQKIDQFLDQHQRAPSALARALLAEKQFEWKLKTEDVLADIAARSDAFATALEEFDATRWWKSEKESKVATRIVEFYHEASFLSRWRDQFRQRWLKFQL